MENVHFEGETKKYESFNNFTPTPGHSSPCPSPGKWSGKQNGPTSAAIWQRVTTATTR
jgi:hypothetical protein